MRALTHFNPTVYFVAPQILQMPDYLLEDLRKNNIKYEILSDFRDCLDKIDVFYMTRIQKERFLDVDEYEKLKGVYIINKKIQAIKSHNRTNNCDFNSFIKINC